MLYVFSLNSDVCQLSLNQAGGIKIKPLKWTLTEAYYHLDTCTQWKLTNHSHKSLRTIRLCAFQELSLLPSVLQGTISELCVFFLLCQWRCNMLWGTGWELPTLPPSKWSRAQLELATEGHKYANQERGTGAANFMLPQQKWKSLDTAAQISHTCKNL